MPRIYGWYVDKQNTFKNRYVWLNKFKGTQVKAFKAMHDKYWGVSILAPKKLYHYLAGGNSRFHTCTKTKALQLARNWMKKHPRG